MLKAIKNAYNKHWAEEEIGGKIAFFSAGLSMGALFLFLLSSIIFMFVINPVIVLAILIGIPLLAAFGMVMLVIIWEVFYK